MASGVIRMRLAKCSIRHNGLGHLFISFFGKIAVRRLKRFSSMLDNSTDSQLAHDPFVYRIITPDDWDSAQRLGHIPPVEVDRKDGYFHLSPHDQILTTAALYFDADTQPAALEFDAQVLGPGLVWESVPERGGRHFPHLYARTFRSRLSPPLSNSSPLKMGLPLVNGQRSDHWKPELYASKNGHLPTNEPCPLSVGPHETRYFHRIVQSKS